MGLNCTKGTYRTKELKDSHIGAIQPRNLWGYPAQKSVGYPAQKSVGLSSPEAQTKIEKHVGLSSPNNVCRSMWCYTAKKEIKKGAIQPKKRFVEACGALQPKKKCGKT